MPRCFLPGLAISLASFSLTSAVVAQTFIPAVRADFSQAFAKKTADGLLVQQVITEAFPRPVLETYLVAKKVPTTLIDPATKKEVTTYEEITEARTRTRIEMVVETREVIQTYPWTAVSGSYTAGKGLPVGELQDRLAARTLVIIRGASLFPQEYAPLFKPETIVLKLSPAEALPPTPADDSAAPVGEGDAPPLTPQFQQLSMNKQGQYSFRTSNSVEVSRTVPVMKTEKRILDGKEVAVVVCVPVLVTEQQLVSHTTTYPAEAVAGTTLDKEPLTDRHREALQAREIPVVVVTQGQPVDPSWLANVRPGMLLMTVPGSFDQTAAPAPAPRIAVPAALPARVPMIPAAP